MKKWKKIQNGINYHNKWKKNPWFLYVSKILWTNFELYYGCGRIHKKNQKKERFEIDIANLEKVIPSKRWIQFMEENGKKMWLKKYE